ncbi:hypothetical protein F4678DRAFT_483026 [Xylaria arbuscula]|nr:hypothetical protein F4678DRAFT_483026 [Xylaria arbuscula]
MTNLGPLTTDYVPSGSGCNWTYAGITTGATYLQRGTVSDCFPSKYNSYPAFYFSPGICQRGYTYACSGDVGLPGVTGATCCPTAFTCIPNLRENEPNACGSRFAWEGSLSLDVLSYVGGVPTKVGATTMTYTSGDQVYAKGLEVRRAATDLEWNTSASETGTTTMADTQPSSTATTNPRATGTTTTSGVESQTQFTSTVNTSSAGDSPSGDRTSSDGSSSHVGEEIVIIFAVAIVVLLLIIGLLVAVYRCGKRRGRAIANTNVKQVSDIGQAYDGTTEQWRSAHELEEQRRIQELRASRDPAELIA